MINVTQSSMPDYNKYCEQIKEIWNNKWLTNNGNNLLQLESELKKYLKCKNISLLSNGTLALMIALELFDFKVGDEIITTPFTYVATTSSVLWEKFIPVFADIEPDTFNISPNSIVSKITNKTKAILAVHVFGNPCEVEKIEQIAEKYNLKVIYDAAHCFGIEYKENSIFNYGDVSTLSFHATKVFHTIEGGAIISPFENKVLKANQLRAFGYDETFQDVNEIGMNAKMNEFQAIMGLLNLEIIEETINKRKYFYDLYKKELNIKIKYQKLNSGLTKYNYIYFPILLENQIQRDFIYDSLLKERINSRKYFYPLINKFSRFQHFNQDTPIALDISERILHLPLYSDLSDEIVYKIIDNVNSCL